MVITEIYNKPTPEYIFDTAIEYDYAATSLLKGFGNNGIMAMNPILFNQAFALELYLKCLIFLTNGKKAGKTHELSKLYLLLDKIHQEQIDSLFNKQIFIKRIKRSGVKLKSRWKETKFKGKPSLNYTIEEILTFSNFSIMEHRYPFDYASKRYYGIGYLSNAVLEYIIQLKPEWKSKAEPLKLVF